MLHVLEINNEGNGTTKIIIVLVSTLARSLTKGFQKQALLGI